MITKHLFYLTIFNVVFIVNARNSVVNILVALIEYYTMKLSNQNLANINSLSDIKYAQGISKFQEKLRKI